MPLDIFLHTLREYRRSILAWGAGIALTMISQPAGYSAIFTGPDRARQIQDLKQLAGSFSFILGTAYDLDTFGGFLHFRLLGLLPVVLGLYGLLMGSALIRGEEERGSLDVLLTTPHSRREVLLQKWTAMIVAVMAIAFLSWAGLMVGVIASKVSLEPGAAGLAHLNSALVGVMFGTLGLVLGQLTTRAGAAGIAGGVLAATYLMNNSSSSLGSLEGVKYLSPFYYESLSKPLAPSVGTNWVAMAGLALAGVPLLGAALAMYLQRDHNNVFRGPGRRGRATKAERPARPAKTGVAFSPWLAGVFSLGLRGAIKSALIWGTGMSIYIAIILSALNRSRQQMLDLLNSDTVRSFGLQLIPTNEGLLSISLFTSILLLYAAYAVVQVAGWTGEENSGRIEMVLSTPHSRIGVLLSRFAVVVIGSAVMVGMTGLTFGLMAGLNNVEVKAGNAAGAFGGIWVLCLVIMAAGFALAALSPGQAVAVLGGLVALSYLIELLGALFRLPSWMVDLSVFHHYGQPIVNGFNWGGQLALIAVAAALLTAALARFRQRDILR